MGKDWDQIKRAGLDPPLEFEGETPIAVLLFGDTKVRRDMEAKRLASQRLSAPSCQQLSLFLALVDNSDSIASFKRFSTVQTTRYS